MFSLVTLWMGQPSSAPPSDVPDTVRDTAATISAPIATLLVGITAAAVTLVTTLVVGRREAKTYETELTVQRLNELYAPVRLLLLQDGVLSAQLKAGLPAGAHVLDNIELINRDTDKKTIVKQIIAINKKIAGILETKSGLCVGEMPQSFAAFLGHHYMLDRAFAGKSFVPNGKYEYFPKQFEVDIEKGYSRLRSDLRKRLTPWYRRMANG